MTQATDILIVEDDPASRRLLLDVLENAGYRCQAVDNGEEGVQLASELSPRAILMDIKLPGVSGLVAAGRIREAEARRRETATIRTVLIIGMSAHAMKNDLEIIDQAGFDHFITKPFSYRVLLRYLQENLPADGMGL
ncbi:FOG: CheY-like receiver [Hahella chejuensis KCTC 2396]|uniref:FOG: CheY-like receiver n=1 Tax=Hahella chejuensis (strain KCTC 2396) TaxID=349521 RepID=Q2SEF3_HAHCH|nr:response regulator [Hahella chejuensis]ABC30971.1 FOG: CheY-like receiver [Hahella chejuensis KCTC 2396]